jgi:hypothetical protein
VPPDIPKIVGHGGGFGFGDLVDFAVAIGVDVFDIVKAIIEKIIDQFNLNCPFGLKLGCTIMEILHYVFLALLILAGIAVTVALIKIYRSLKTKKANAKAFGKEVSSSSIIELPKSSDVFRKSMLTKEASTAAESTPLQSFTTPVDQKKLNLYGF